MAQKYRFTADDLKRIKEEAEDQWDSILWSLAPALRQALEKPGRHVPCPNPGHTNSKDGFRVYRDVETNGASVCNTCGRFGNGFGTLMWINGTSFWDTVEEVADYLRYGKTQEHEPVHRPVQQKPKVDKEKAEQKALETLNKVGQEAISIRHPDAEPGRLYYAKRGIRAKPPASLRFHRALDYYDDDRKHLGAFPAILALIQDKDGRPANIHRTFITPEGFKAPVPTAKKLMKSLSSVPILGGAIRLMPVEKVMALTEGVETALAVWEATKIPVWAAVNATMLEEFVPPPGVEQILVFADKDQPTKQHPKGHGQEAATALVKRLWSMGIKASAIVPPGEIPADQKSLDWLDVLRTQGASAFPSFQTVAEVISLRQAA